MLMQPLLSFPTPSAEKGQFTNRYVLKALESIGAALRKKEGYHLVVITSTVDAWLYGW